MTETSEADALTAGVGLGVGHVMFSIAVEPGESYSVFGYASFLTGKTVMFLGTGVGPSEAVYSGGGGGGGGGGDTCG